MTTTTAAATTTAQITITPVPVECGWTPWLNTDTPDVEEGDIEDLAKIHVRKILFVSVFCITIFLIIYK